MSTLVTGGAGFIGSNREGFKGPLTLIKASCNELPGLALHPENVVHWIQSEMELGRRRKRVASLQMI